jgi:hypothetical protein
MDDFGVFCCPSATIRFAIGGLHPTGNAERAVGGARGEQLFNKNVKIHSRIQILIRLTSNKRISSRVRGSQ